MARLHRLDPDAPLRSIRELAGVTVTEAARARGVAQPSEHQAEGQGERIQVSTLRQAAEALGFRLILGVEKID